MPIYLDGVEQTVEKLSSVATETTAILVAVSSIAAETTLIHVETSAIKVSVEALQADTTAMKPILNSVHTETSAMAVILSSVKSETTSIKVAAEALQADTTAMKPILSSVHFETSHLHLDAHHLIRILPLNPNETITFTAGATANEYNDAAGGWATFSDSSGNDLTAVASSHDIYITSVQVESVSTKDVIFQYQIGYESSVVALEGRFTAGTTGKLPTVQQQRMRPLLIPTGSTVVYRTKCEQASETFNLNIRYYTSS